MIYALYCQHRKKLKYSPKHKGYVSTGTDHAWDCEVTYRWDDVSRELVPINECGPVKV